MFFALSEVPPQPWKNGHGTTREICSRHAGARLLWRMSVAEIAQDGSFSPFPGLMRAQIIIAGAGLRLSAAQAQFEARQFEPVHFSGDIPLTAQLLMGPCSAFNVIYDASYVRVALHVAEQGTVYVQGAQTAVLVVRGRASSTGWGPLSEGQGYVQEGVGTIGVVPGSRVITVGLSPA